MKNNKKIAFFGCKHTTKECINLFLSNIGRIDFLITIDKDKSKKAQVAGYLNLKDFAKKNNIKIIFAEKYNLKSQNDFKLIKDLNIDIAFVIGWQRLIPSNILALAKHGFYGMHGSADNLPKGRGRSPMNWALITGRKSFYTNLFNYDSSIDGGKIVATKKFEINEFDTIETLHYKNTLAMYFLIRKSLNDLLDDKIQLKEQNENEATYFPKRNPADGAIDWNLSSIHLYNFVRAITKPFPGAYSYVGKNLIKIWELKPFSKKDYNFDLTPGTIISVFSNGKFIIKTGDGIVLVEDYDIVNNKYIKEKICLTSEPFESIYKDIEKRYDSMTKNKARKEITLMKMKKLYQ